MDSITLDEMFKEIEKEEKRDSYIVFLRQRYEYNHNPNEWEYHTIYLEYEWHSDDWVWEWDFNEGQEHVEVLGYLPLDSLSSLIEGRFGR